MNAILILAVLASIGLMLVFFLVLSPEERAKDPTTVVTFGTVLGLLVGIISSTLGVRKINSIVGESA